MSDEEREPLTVLILKDVLEGIEHHYGAEGVAQVAAFAMLKNRARETNRVIDELEREFGLTDNSKAG